MAKERLHELKETDNSFQLRGLITNTKGQRFYKSGNTKNGGFWNSTEFGVKIADGKTVFVTLNGFPRAEVFYYKSGENGSKGDTKRVTWKDRKKSPGAGYRLIGVNISTGKDAEGKNINETFTEYDAVEWIKENLHDNDSVFIKGNLRFSSYTDKQGQTKKKIELVPTQISYTQNPVDFKAEDYKEMAEFENTLVFSALDKETDKKDKPTGRCILSGYSINYSSVEPISFIIDAEHAKLANNLKKVMKPGYAIKTFGRVDVINNVSAVNTDDEGWGETSPMQRVNAPTKREYVVYRAEPNSIDRESYSEEAIAAAIKKIKAAKTAVAKFEGTSNVEVNDEDWTTEDGPESDLDW